MIDTSMLLITVAVVPQIYKTWKNRKDIKDIDFKFAFLTLIGNILAITWGILASQWAIGFLNAVYFVWSLMSLIFMVINR